MTGVASKLRRRATALAAVVMLATILPSFSQETEDFPSAQGGRSAGLPIPNVELPKHIPAPEGQLTLHADFAGSSGNGVPLYLVNRTDRPIEFSTQDHDLFVKLEYEFQDGAWERAQAHLSSWCGNSYYPVSLPPGQHFAFTGYMPTAGTKARVRFSSYGSPRISSNEGEGFFLPRDVEHAQRDAMELSTPPTIDSLLNPKESGTSISSVPPEARVVALHLVHASGPHPYYRKAAAGLAENWEKGDASTADEIAAAKAIRRILAEPWPKRRDDEALLKRCARALSAKDTADEFGMPENKPALVWQVVRDLAGSGKIKDPKAWQPVVDFAVANETPGNVFGVMTIAATPRLADELLPNTFFEKHIFDSDAFVQRTCADTLSRRKHWARLAELGWKLPPEAQIVVLKALSRPSDLGISFMGATRNPDYASGEHKFWEHCLKTQPLEAAYALQLANQGDHTTFNRTVHDPLHHFLATEAAKGAGVDEDFELGPDGYKLRMAVELLGSWHLEEDDPIFRKLLEHRGFEKSEFSTGDGDRFLGLRFGIRQAAKEALLRRGQPVPSDIVTERRIPL